MTWIMNLALSYFENLYARAVCLKCLHTTGCLIFLLLCFSLYQLRFLKFCRQILSIIEVLDMLYKQLSRKRDYLGFIKDLELHSWYVVVIDFPLVKVYIHFLCI